MSPLQYGADKYLVAHSVILFEFDLQSVSSNKITIILFSAVGARATLILYTVREETKEIALQPSLQM